MKQNQNHSCIGSCLLCGSEIEQDGLYFDSGNGYLHKFCIEIRKRAM